MEVGKAGTAPASPAAAAAACEVDLTAPVEADRNWARIMAIAPAVTALGCVVSEFIDVTATRVQPTYTGVMDGLRRYGREDKVPGFQAAWGELSATPDGRAVIAVCKAAAARGVLLGRLSNKQAAAQPDLEDQLLRYYKGTPTLEVLLAAVRYYRAHAAPPPTTAAPEWPSLESLWMYRRGASYDGTPAEKWHVAVAPAMAVLERIMERLVDVKTMAMTPTYDDIVMWLQGIERDNLVPHFEAEWKELSSTPEGRAVIAVCAAAADSGVALGWYDMPGEAASVPDLQRTLTKWFKREEFLPVLLAAARYYLKHTADADATAGVGGASGAGASAAAAAAAGAGCKRTASGKVAAAAAGSGAGCTARGKGAAAASGGAGSGGGGGGGGCGGGRGSSGQL